MVERQEKMKKFLTVLTLFLLCVFCAISFMACENNDNAKAELVSASGFDMENENLKMTVSNDTKTFSFLNIVTVSKNATWVISTDKFGMNAAATKTVPLVEGDNQFYLIVTSGDDKTVNVYPITVRRKPMYNVGFSFGFDYIYNREYYMDLWYNRLLSQCVEEGFNATTPTVSINEMGTKLGYNFVGWDFDFTTPITENITIMAIWEVKPELADFEFSFYGANECRITGIKDVNIEEITISEYVTDIGYNVFDNCTRIKNINVSENNPNYKSIDGNLYSKDGTTLIQYATNKDAYCFIIPDGVTSIDLSKFKDCFFLNDLVMPKSSA